MKKLFLTFWILILLVITAFADITTLPTPPQRSDPATFSTRADAFLGALPTFGDEANALAAEVNGYKTDAEAAEAAAIASAATAQSSANFKGDWSDQTGAADIPYSVYHGGNYWQLVSNLVDVTASEPGVTAAWKVIGGIILSDDIDQLQSFSVVEGAVVYLKGRTTAGDGGQGVFVGKSGDFTSEVTADTLSGIYAPSDADSDGSEGCWVRQYNGVLHNSWYGSGQAGIKAMLDAAAAHTAMVIDPGDYTLSSSITTTLPGYNTISAYGAYFACTHNGLVFDFNYTDVAQTPMFRWFGGRFENTNATKTASIAMYFQEWRNVVVADARFERFWKAIEAVDRDTYVIRECHFYANEYSISFDNTLSAGIFGDLILGVYNCHFSLTNMTVGIYADGIIGELNIDGCSFNGASASGYDIWWKNTGNTSGMRAGSITNNHFEQGVAGQKCVYIQDTATGAPYRGIKISGNAFNNDGPDAVVVESIWGLDITANTFSQSSSTPLNIDANCLKVNIGANGWSTGAITFACPRSEISMFPYMTSANNVVAIGYAGDSFSTSSATIDMSAAIPSIFPTNITPKGYYIVIQARDSASSTTAVCRVDVAKDNTISSQQRLMCRVGDASNDTLQCVSGFVPCDSNGDIYINIIASGASTMDVYVSVTGIAL